MNDYTARDKKNYGDTDVAKVAYPKFLEKLSVCQDLFHEYEYSKIMDGTDFERSRAISGAVDFIVAVDKDREWEDFLKEALMLKLSLSLCAFLVEEAMRIGAAQKEGEQAGLNADELAFYDALTKPQVIKDFYENEELIVITKEFADVLHNNRTFDWQKRDSARAKMRMMIKKLLKKLLKKHKYLPEGMDDAVHTFLAQCELWTDINDME